MKLEIEIKFPDEQTSRFVKDWCDSIKIESLIKPGLNTMLFDGDFDETILYQLLESNVGV